MLFSDIAILDENLDVREGMHVGVKNGKIAYIGSEPPSEDYGEKYDGRGRLLMSGLCNAHTHVAMTLMRGYAENMPLADWLSRGVWPFEDAMGEQEFYWGTLLGLAEMIRFGTTSCSEMYFLGRYMIPAIVESGMLCNLSMAVVSKGEDDIDELRNYRDGEWLYENYNGLDGGRVLIDACLYGEYSVSDKTACQAAERYIGRGRTMHVHLSETRKENAECVSRHGVTPTRFFAERGVFDMRALAAHCVHLSREDMGILADKGVSVASCPVSNLKLASGVADVRSLMDLGVNIALGTDGPASNNNLNLFEEMKLFALLHKGVTGSSEFITPKEAVRAATVNGFAAQGRSNCGLVKQGFDANLIALDITGPHMQPRHSLLNNVVYSAQGSDVTLTMVNGRVLYQDGQFTTIDIEKAKREAGSRALKIARGISK